VDSGKKRLINPFFLRYQGIKTAFFEKIIEINPKKLDSVGLKIIFAKN
jgi:hypothetical protein